MADYTNPTGYTPGTSGDDYFLVTLPLSANTTLDGAEGADRLRYDVAYSQGVTFRATRGGMFNGFINAGPFEPGFSFMNFEVIEFFGTAHDDRYELSILPGADLTTNFDARGGNDRLVLNFGQMTDGQSFAVDGGTVTSAYGQFLGFETFEIQGGSGNDTLDGGSYGDYLYGGSGADILHGDEGNDFLWSAGSTGGLDDLGLEHDQLNGDAGDDVLAIGYGDDADGGSGTDTLWLSLGARTSGASLNTAGITSGGAFDIGGGTIRNVEMLAYLRGTQFDDALTIATQATLLTIDGGFGIDTVTSQGSSVDFRGGADRDTLISGAAGDIFDGGLGIDTVDYRNATAGISLTMGTPGFSWAGVGGDQLTSVERVVGSGYDDTLTGNSGDDTLEGGEGNDHLDGAGGSDTLRGDEGDDVLNGGAGIDTLSGGGGNDTFYVDDAADVVIEAEGEGTDQVIASVSYALAAGSEVETLQASGSAAIDLTGNEYNNTLIGNSAANALYGLGGNDILLPGAGKDAIYGGAGTDTIVLEDSVLTGEVFDGGADFDTLKLRGLSAQFYGATVSGIEEVRFDVSSGPSGAGFYASQIAASGITRIVGSDGYATFTVRVDGNSGTFTMPNFVLENWNSSIDPLTTPGDVLSLSATAGTGDFTLNAREGLASVQALTGGSGNDTLNGSSGRDILVGNGGVNVLNGNGGDDILRVLNYAYPGVVDIGLGSVFNGGDGWDALQLGGVINFQASVSGIEQIHLEPVSGTDPDGGLKAEVTISAQTMAQMSSSLVLSGSGKITVTLAPGDTFDASGYVHAAGSSVALVVDASAAGGSASGSASDDAFYFGAAFSAASTVDGGAGSNDQIGLRGDYTGANALVLGSSTITGVEVIAALPGFDYAITTVDANVPNGGTLKIFAGQLGAGDNLTFNGSAETNGNFMVYAGAGTDLITTGAGIDGIYFGPGKFDPTVDRVDGGTGTNDQLALDGHYAITLDGTAIKNIDAIVLLKGVPGDLATYNLTIANSLVGATETMTLWGTPVETAITINGAAETDGNLKIFGGTAGDMLTGGAGNDWFWGGAGGDSMTGGAGADTFAYTDVLESGMLAQDEIYDFAAGDRLDLAQIDADAATAGDQAFHLGATAGHTGDVVLSYDAGTNFTAVSLHIDGDGAADAIIFLLGHHLGLGVADFVL